MADKRATKTMVFEEQTLYYCPECKEWLEYDAFTPTRHRSTGINSYCRPCANKRAKERYKAKRGGKLKREHRQNLVGKQFRHFTVLSYYGSNSFNKSLWNVKCQCGAETVKSAEYLKFTNFTRCMYCE